MPEESWEEGIEVGIGTGIGVALDCIPECKGVQRGQAAAGLSPWVVRR